MVRIVLEQLKFGPTSDCPSRLGTLVCDMQDHKEQLRPLRSSECISSSRDRPPRHKRSMTEENRGK